MTVSRAYGQSHGGHHAGVGRAGAAQGADERWTLRRSEDPPPHEHRHELQPPLFAGKWRCVANKFFGGDEVHIEIGGDPTRWAVVGAHAPPRAAELRKVDLMDLVEEGGNGVTKHHIGSLSLDKSACASLSSTARRGR